MSDLPPSDAPGDPQPSVSPAPSPAQAESPSPADAPAPAPQTLPAQPPTHAPGAHDNEPKLVVRYGQMRMLGEFTYNLSSPPRPGTRVVIRTERGVELGKVVLAIGEGCPHKCVTAERLSQYIAGNGPEYPLSHGGRILRIANPQDIIDQRHLENSAREEATFCRQQIRELNLPMKLVTVEHLLGGERILFCFSAESRVDFRELVRRLASQYRTRIEMRQVGARDEARLVADYERCGQRCCCQAFLKCLQPVSMRMAKTQKATLDPSKISGRCGRLMCCLRYEDAGYEELRKKLPRKNTWVRTEKVLGRVVDVQILTQLVMLSLVDGSQTAVANEDILERDVPAPALPQREPHREARRSEPRSEARLLRDELPSPAPEAPREKPSAVETTKPRNESDVDKDDPLAPVSVAEAGDIDSDGDEEEDARTEETSSPTAGENAPGQNAQESSGKKRRRRRRRGRRHRGRGGQNNSGGQPSGGPSPQA